jgi:hypothetical protein
MGMLRWLAIVVIGVRLTGEEFAGTPLGHKTATSSTNYIRSRILVYFSSYLSLPEGVALALWDLFDRTPMEPIHYR